MHFMTIVISIVFNLSNHIAHLSSVASQTRVCFFGDTQQNSLLYCLWLFFLLPMLFDVYILYCYWCYMHYICLRMFVRNKKKLEPKLHTLGLRLKGRHFVENIFVGILLNHYILIEISLNYILMNTTDNKSTSIERHLYEAPGPMR